MKLRLVDKLTKEGYNEIVLDHGAVVIQVFAALPVLYIYLDQVLTRFKTDYTGQLGNEHLQCSREAGRHFVES